MESGTDGSGNANVTYTPGNEDLLYTRPGTYWVFVLLTDGEGNTISFPNGNFVVWTVVTG